MSDIDENVAEVERQMSEATGDFQEALQTEDPFGVVREFGEMVTGVSEGLGDFGNGLGEALEEGAQKSFHSEEFGSGFFQETGEALMSVTGEFAEMTAEASAGVGEAVGVAVGGVIEAVGGAGENLWDAVGDIGDGDIGDAAEHVFGAGKSILGLGETAVDLTGAAVSAVGEVVEGVGAMGYEVVEGAAEMVVGAASDIGDLAEGAWEAINPFD